MIFMLTSRLWYPVSAITGIWSRQQGGFWRSHAKGLVVLWAYCGCECDEWVFGVFFLFFSGPSSHSIGCKGGGLSICITCTCITACTWLLINKYKTCSVLIYSYINTSGNWENEKLCGNTTPEGWSVFTQFRVFPISTSVAITIY
jgi:hypothetical protein